MIFVNLADRLLLLTVFTHMPVIWFVNSETSFENPAHETSPEVCHTVSSQELHNDLTHYYNVPGVSSV